jgi:Na+/H+-translocating membrane pyrophosphatase
MADMSDFSPVAAGRLGGIKPMSFASREQALRTVTNALDAVESERAEIARAYAVAPGHSDIEHALGESLTYLRKAIEKLIKARNELMQQPLPMD